MNTKEQTAAIWLAECARNTGLNTQEMLAALNLAAKNIKFGTDLSVLADLEYPQ
jgi:hypothetical protein